MDARGDTTGPRRPPGWALARALCMVYGLAALPIAVLMLGLLPLAAWLGRRIGRDRRPDPWWPITRWAMLLATLPRLAEWLEQRL